MSVYVSIQLSAHVFAIPPAAGFVCCTAAIRLAATSLASVYWLGEVVGPVAQRFGEGASTSRTFSAITDLIAVVQREADRLFVSIFQPMYACSTSSCLPAGIVVDSSYILAFEASPPDVEMARLSPYVTATSRRQSRAACVMVQAPFIACSVSRP